MGDGGDHVTARHVAKDGLQDLETAHERHSGYGNAPRATSFATWLGHGVRRKRS